MPIEVGGNFGSPPQVCATLCQGVLLRGRLGLADGAGAADAPLHGVGSARSPR